MSFFVNKFYDCLGSYGYWSKMSEVIKKDEKGNYKEKLVVKEVPCGCHPETCCHPDGKWTKVFIEKHYIN